MNTSEWISKLSANNERDAIRHELKVVDKWQFTWKQWMKTKLIHFPAPWFVMKQRKNRQCLIHENMTISNSLCFIPTFSSLCLLSFLECVFDSLFPFLSTLLSISIGFSSSSWCWYHHIIKYYLHAKLALYLASLLARKIILFISILSLILNIKVNYFFDTLNN
jgi:hypothetical protein